MADAKLDRELIGRLPIEKLLRIVPEQVQQAAKQTWLDRSEGREGGADGWCAFALACDGWRRYIERQGSFQYCVHGCPVYGVLKKTCHGWAEHRGWEEANLTGSVAHMKIHARAIYEWLVVHHDRLLAGAKWILLREKGCADQETWHKESVEAYEVWQQGP